MADKVTYLSSMALTTEVLVGTDVGVAAREARILAGRLGVRVEFSFNGITCIMPPGGDAKKLVGEYYEQFDRGPKARGRLALG